MAPLHHKRVTWWLWRHLLYDLVMCRCQQLVDYGVVEDEEGENFLQAFTHLQFTARIGRFCLKTDRILTLETLSLVRVDGRGEGPSLLVACVKFGIKRRH